MTNNSSPSLKEVLLREAWGDLENRNEADFKESLRLLDVSTDDSLELFANATAAANKSIKRLQYEAAKSAVLANEGCGPIKFASYDIAHKKEIFARVQICAANTGVMTIAARNRTITVESYIDAFLEACFRLGLIDIEGNLRVKKD
jgi:hypothetical protein